jgi:hypothetical protein
VLNYAATVWLTWFCMPVGSDDVTADEHDLSAEEAQFGVLSLVDRVVADNAESALLAERFNLATDRDEGRHAHPRADD